MRKRFVTTILTCLMCIVCIFGATACNTANDTDGDNKDNTIVTPETPDTPDKSDSPAASDIVTEEEWKYAFEKTFDSATNLTAKVGIESYQKCTVTTSELVDSKMNIKATLSNTESGNIRTVEMGEYVIEESALQSEGYNVQCIVIDGQTAWSAEQSGYAGEEMSEWRLYSREYDSQEDLMTSYKNGILSNLNVPFYYIEFPAVLRDSESGSNAENTKKVPVSELYSSFKYMDNKYSASLKPSIENTYRINDNITMRVSLVMNIDVTIKGGYIIEYIVTTLKDKCYFDISEWGIKGATKEQLMAYPQFVELYPEFKDFTFDVRSMLQCTLSDFGKTEVTFPEEVLALIEAEKAKTAI